MPLWLYTCMHMLPGIQIQHIHRKTGFKSSESNSVVRTRAVILSIIHQGSASAAMHSCTSDLMRGWGIVVICWVDPCPSECHLVSGVVCFFTSGAEVSRLGGNTSDEMSLCWKCLTFLQKSALPIRPALKRSAQSSLLKPRVSNWVLYNF